MFNLFIQKEGEKELNRTRANVTERLKTLNIGTTQEQLMIADEVYGLIEDFKDYFGENDGFYDFDEALRCAVINSLSIDLDIQPNYEYLNRQDINFRHTPEYMISRLSLPHFEEGVAWYDIERFAGLYLVSNKADIFSPAGKLVFHRDKLFKKTDSRFLQPFSMRLLGCHRDYVIIKDILHNTHVYDKINLLREARGDTHFREDVDETYWGETESSTNIELDLIGWITLSRVYNDEGFENDCVDSILGVIERGDRWPEMKQYFDWISEAYKSCEKYEEFSTEPFHKFKRVSRSNEIDGPGIRF